MIYMLMAFVTGQCINLPSVADSTAVALGSNELSDRPAADGVTAPQDTIAIITEGVVSDDIYADSAVTTIAPENLVYDPVPWKELGISAGVFTFSSLFIDEPPSKQEIPLLGSRSGIAQGERQDRSRQLSAVCAGSSPASALRLRIQG